MLAADLDDAGVVVRRALAREQDEGLFAQCAERHLRLGRQRVRRRQAGQKRFLVQRRGRQGGRQPVGVDQAEIQLLGEQGVDLVLRVQLHDDHFDPRMSCLEGLQPVRQAVEQRGADKPEPQPADLPGLHLAGQRAGFVSAGQQRGGVGLEGRAGRCQPHALAVAVEQPGTDAGLQLLDGHRQRRLRDGQTLGGAAEMQFLGQSQEVAQMPELHGPVGRRGHRYVESWKSFLELDTNRRPAQYSADARRARAAGRDHRQEFRRPPWPARQAFIGTTRCCSTSS
mmetsp:Transcript_21513/g.83500  ORF Transcript_21513/g.83500 Transcript_21513/m.83500 type:complete len:283 (+) Transcript_21513:602-1450(+)